MRNVENICAESERAIKPINPSWTLLEAATYSDKSHLIDMFLQQILDAFSYTSEVPNRLFVLPSMCPSVQPVIM